MTLFSIPGCSCPVCVEARQRDAMANKMGATGATGPTETLYAKGANGPAGPVGPAISVQKRADPASQYYKDIEERRARCLRQAVEDFILKPTSFNGERVVVALQDYPDAWAQGRVRP